MPDPIITIEDLSKSYTIGHQGDQSDGLRHALEQAKGGPAAKPPELPQPSLAG